MNPISEVIAPAVSKPYAGYLKDIAAILCGLGIVLAAGMATSGLEYERRLLLEPYRF